jgi:NAD+ diphosphatase
MDRCFFQGVNVIEPPGEAELEAGMISDRFIVPGLEADKRIEAFLLSDEAALPQAWNRGPLRNVFTQAAEPGLLLRAFHVMQWRRDSRYCGSCGSPNADSPKELARLCPRCGRVEYPRICPAVIVLICRGDTILLGHNRNFRPGMYSLIAGFNEAGETLEETVQREIREETAVEVEDIRFAASQPWPFPASLMIGFTAQWKAGLVQADGIEIEDARWFSRADLQKDPSLLPGPGSIARRLIEAWLSAA